MAAIYLILCSIFFVLVVLWTKYTTPGKLTIGELVAMFICCFLPGINVAIAFFLLLDLASKFFKASFWDKGIL